MNRIDIARSSDLSSTTSTPLSPTSMSQGYTQESQFRDSTRAEALGGRQRRGTDGKDEDELDVSVGSCEADGSPMKENQVGAGSTEAMETVGSSEGIQKEEKGLKVEGGIEVDIRRVEREDGGTHERRLTGPLREVDDSTPLGGTSTNSTTSPSTSRKNSGFNEPITRGLDSATIPLYTSPFPHHEFSSASSNSSATSSSSTSGFASSSGFSSNASASSVTSASSTTTYSVSSHGREREKQYSDMEGWELEGGGGPSRSRGGSGQGEKGRMDSTEFTFGNSRQLSQDSSFASGLGLCQFSTSTSPVAFENDSKISLGPNERQNSSPLIYTSHSPQTYLSTELTHSPGGSESRSGEDTLETMGRGFSELTLSPPAIPPPSRSISRPTSTPLAPQDSSATIMESIVPSTPTSNSNFPPASSLPQSPPSKLESSSVFLPSPRQPSLGGGSSGTRTETPDSRATTPEPSEDGGSDLEGTIQLPDNFAIVQDGVYRSSFPRRKHFEFLKTLGLKTVLTLVQEEYPQENLEFLREQGIQFYQFSIPANKDPSIRIPDEKIVSAMKVVLDRRNHPLLIHCNKGKHRTGCLIGCLRRLQAWSFETISDEYVKYSHPKSRQMDLNFIEAFKGLTKIRDVVEPNRPHLPIWAHSCFDEEDIDEVENDQEFESSAVKIEDVTTPMALEERRNLEVDA